MAKKRITITSSPLMSVVGSKVINQAQPEHFDEKFYANIISDLKPSNGSGHARLNFDDIEDGTEHAIIEREPPSEIETGFNNETPTAPETGFDNETPSTTPHAEVETGFNNETPTTPETGFNDETPVELGTGSKKEPPPKIETTTKLKGPNLVKFDLNSLDREIVPIDCLRLEAIVRKVFEDKKLRVDGWVKINRETLKHNKINGARLKDTRLICKARGTIDFKIENQGIPGKEQVYYKPLK